MFTIPYEGDGEIRSAEFTIEIPAASGWLLSTIYFVDECCSSSNSHRENAAGAAK